MASLSLKYLGLFQATLGEEPVTEFRTNKVQALLIYLASEPGPQSRDSLMDLLWPGLPARSARVNLRQILYQLRKTIPEVDPGGEGETTDVPLLIANRQEIQLNPAAVEVDILQFEFLLDRTQSHEHPDLLECQRCRADLARAVELYRGDFLADFYLDDSDVFENWAQGRRDGARRKVLDALELLTTIFARDREYGRARSYAERQLEVDDLREPAYRQLMEIMVLSGQRAEAAAVYEEYRQRLSEELGMEPSRRTAEMFERIMAGDLGLESPLEQRIRGFDLHEEIGEGAFGKIHLASQPSVGREVVVKVIREQYANDPEFIRRFENEAQTVARLEHPFIVPLYDYWRDPDGAYLVMRYLRGGSLLSALEPGAWEPQQAARMLDQVAGALSAAHKQGVVHRDIKPANILLDEEGNSYLSDFGIAKDLSDSAQLTATGAVVGTLDYISPEQILNDELTGRADIYSLGAVLYETLTGEKPFPDSSVANLLHSHLKEPLPLVSASRPDLPQGIDEVIQRATAKQPADRYADALEMAAAFHRALAGEGVDVSLPVVLPEEEIYNPYKGLRAFQEADSEDFHGREALVTQLLGRLADFPFLAVVGPSGSGKSSVVKAGLIPALREGAIASQAKFASSDKWFVAEMVPGRHPLGELELALWPIAVDPPPSLVEPMQHDTHGLLRTIRRILPNEPGAQLLLVIDQFEELFTLVEDEKQRDFFIDSLLMAISDPRSPLRVVVTLRADFYDRPLQEPALGKLLKENTEIVLPMTAEELTWAVREPARRVAVGLEGGLAEAIVADVSEQPGGLPLMQYALTELFERRRGRLMTREKYEAIGGVLGALGRRADGIYDDLDPAGQEASRQLFLRLVTLGEGIEDTRRRVLREDLEAIEEQLAIDGDRSVDIGTVIDLFGAARLLTFDHDPTTRQPTVEVAHEALLREWGQLRSWLDESRNDLRMERLLDQAAAEWEDADREAGFLLREARLNQFEGWFGSSTVALTGLERAFLAASIADREARQAEEEARHQRELETAKKLAETERARAETEEQRAEEQAQAAAGLRRRAYILGGVVVVAVLLAVAAFFFARQSSENARVAEANFELAAENEADALAAKETSDANADLAATRQGEAEESAQLAIEAQATADASAEEARAQQTIADQEREIALEQAALARSRELAVMAATNLEIDPHLSMLLALEGVSIAQTNEAISALHSSTMASRLRGRYTLHDGEAPVTSVVLSPDGVYAASAASSPDGTVRIWEMANGQELFRLPVGSGAVENYSQVTFNSAGSQVAILNPGDDFNLSFWAVPSGEALATVSLPLSTELLTGYALKPDWGQVAVGFDDGSASVWEIPASLGEDGALGQKLYDLPGHTDGSIRLDYSRNGERLVTTSTGEENVIVWNTSTGQEMVRLNMTDLGAREITDPAALSPDGRYLATLDTGDAMVVWDLENTDGGPISTMERHLNLIEGIAFNADGTAVATTSLDQMSRVWDPFSGQELFTLHHNKDLASVALSDDGTHLLTGDGHGDVQIWDLTQNGRSELMSFEAGGIDVYSPIVSPDGSRLAVAYNTLLGATIKVWDLSTGELLVDTGPNDAMVFQMSYSPDGERIASAGSDGMVRIWDADSGEELLTLAGHGEGLFSCCFTGVMDVAYSPDGSRLATAGVDKTARIWDAQTGQELSVLSGNSNGLGNLAFSPDGTRLATASDLPEVKLWDAESGRELFTLSTEHTGALWGLSFSPDGTKLATGGRDRTITIWDLDFVTGAAHLLASLTGHRNTISKIDYSPGGQLLMSQDFGCSELKVWDVSGLPGSLPEELLSLPFSCDFAFPPDGNNLIVAFDDGSMRVITLDIDQLVAIAKSRLTRDFTAEECTRYRIEACPAGEVDGEQ